MSSRGHARSCMPAPAPLLLVIVLSLGATAAGAGVEAGWLPRAVGSRWAYTVHRDHMYWPEDASIDRVFYEGRATQVLEPTAAVANSLAMTESMWLLRGGTGHETRVLRKDIVSAEGGMLLYSSEAIAPEPGSVRYEPPLRLLPTTAPGAKWKVGTYREGNLRIDMKGETVALEDVEVNGKSFPDALRVRYSGELEGSVQVYQGEAEVESGTYDRVSWIARGVGMVQTEITMKAVLKLPDGGRAETSELFRFRLLEADLPK